MKPRPGSGRPSLLLALALSFLQPSSFAAAPLVWIPVVTESYTGFSALAAGSGMIVALNLSSTRQIVSWPQHDPSSQNALPYSGRLLDVAFGNGSFVVGTDGPVLTSTNAIDWSSHTPGTGDILTTVVFGNRIFLGRGHGISRSTDGVDWTAPPHPRLQSGSDLFFAGGLFFISNPLTNFISEDGITWTAAPSGTLEGLYTLTFGDGKFLAVDKHNQVLISEDGAHWAPRGTLDVGRPEIAWGNGCFVAVGGGARAYSRDGLSWVTELSTHTDYDVIFANGAFFAGGSGRVDQSMRIVTLKLNSPGTLSIQGTPNATYEIQSSDLLGNPASAWDSQDTFVMPAHDGSYTWTDPRPQAPYRFYRIVMFQ